jgi:hypothetical protein
MARHPEARGVDPDGMIYLAGAFFGDLRALLGEGKPEALGFVTGQRGQYEEWCDVLGVPDRGALTESLLAQWGVPYLDPRFEAPPPAPPVKVRGKLVPLCKRCGAEDEALFNRRGAGFRSLCRVCDAAALREYRQRRKAKLQGRVS